MDQSPKWSLNPEDYKRWAHNTIVFFAPVVVIYLGSVATSLNEAGFQWSDFRVTNVVAGAGLLYIVNVLLDVFRKYSAGPTE